MKTTLKFAIAALVASAASAHAEPRFTAATETVPELRELYDAADDQCRLAGSQDVKVTVACVSRAIYGQALNERGWCYGKDDQANAEMAWHECTEKSLRFTPLDLPGF